MNSIQAIQIKCSGCQERFTSVPAVADGCMTRFAIPKDWHVKMNEDREIFFKCPTCSDPRPAKDKLPPKHTHPPPPFKKPPPPIRKKDQSITNE